MFKEGYVVFWIFSIEIQNIFMFFLDHSHKEGRSVSMGAKSPVIPCQRAEVGEGRSER